MADQLPDSNNSPSGHESDNDFDPTADMMVNDFDDEHTLDEEEALDESENFDEIDDLQKEGEMPLEELLAMYGYQAGPVIPDKPKERAATSAADSTETVQVVKAPTECEDQVSSQSLINQAATSSSSASEVTLPETATPSALISAQWTLPGNGEPPADTNALLNDDSDWEDDEDCDYEEGDDEPDEAGDWRRSIQVGPEYQAVIPESLSVYDDVPAYENEDTILWEPSKLSEEEVEQYLKVVKVNSADYGPPELDDKPSALNAAPDLTLPSDFSIRDDEQALYILLQAGHKTDEALRRRKMQSSKIGLFESMTSWSEEETREFEDGLRSFGKDFHAIQKNKVPTRTVREIVHFYYLWKKTERHDIFVSQYRIEKKKYTLHPFATDFMDRFAEEQEMMLMSSSSAGSTPASTNTVGCSSSPTPRPLTQPHVQHSMFPSSYNSSSGCNRNQPQVDASNFRSSHVVTSTVTSASIVDFPTNSSYTNGHSRVVSTEGYPTITAAKPVNFPLIDSSTVRRTLEATEVRNMVSSSPPQPPQSTVSSGQSPNLNLSSDTINCK